MKDLTSDFPFAEEVLYLDSACTTLKPKCVIEAAKEYYENMCVCSSGRSSNATSSLLNYYVEETRRTIGKLINAKNPEREIIFTKSCTESINVVSNSFGNKQVFVSNKEHNSNFLPWFEYTTPVVIDLWNTEGNFDLELLENAVTEKTDLISLAQVSNVDGCVLPEQKTISKIAHDNGAVLMFDGAQSVPHVKVDVQKTNIDILTFSLHKMLGPTGLGILYVKEEVQEMIKPMIYGGGIVDNNMNILPAPHKYEAGIQNYAGVCMAKPAIDYLNKIGMENIEVHEQNLNNILFNNLPDSANVLSSKNTKNRCGIVSFTLDGHDTTLLSKILNDNNIITRSGFHCANNYFLQNKLPKTLRVSTYIYNTKNDIEYFCDVLNDLVKKEPAHFKIQEGTCF